MALADRKVIVYNELLDFNEKKSSLLNDKQEVISVSDIIEEVNNSKGYKLYIAELTQEDTDAPVASVLINELDGDLIWSRDGVGSYVATLEGAFTGSVVVTPPCDTQGGELIVSYEYAAGKVNSDSIFLRTSEVTNATGAKINADFCLFSGTYIEVKVFE